MKNIVITLIATAFLIAAGTTSACAMAGKNKHIGSVVSIDMDAMTFTIAADNGQLVTVALQYI